MSAPGYVRTIVKGWLAGIGVPFYDTNNIEQNPADAQWCTVNWEPSLTERITYCQDQRVDGTLLVVFFGQAGIGEDALVAAGEAAMAVFMANVDPTGRLVLILCEQAEDFRAGGDAPLFGVSFRVEYEFMP